VELRKLQILADDNSKKFGRLARAIVMDEVGETDDANKETIMMFTARDMAIGELATKNGHLLTGAAIGVIGTALAFTIYGKIKNKKKDVKQPTYLYKVTVQSEDGDKSDVTVRAVNREDALNMVEHTLEIGQDIINIGRA